MVFSGWCWSGGLGGGLAGGFGFGDTAEGDFEAEGAELADVAGDLAAGVAPAFVVAGAEVGVAGAGVGEQGVVDLELGIVFSTPPFDVTRPILASGPSGPDKDSARDLLPAPARRRTGTAAGGGQCGGFRSGRGARCGRRW